MTKQDVGTPGWLQMKQLGIKIFASYVEKPLFPQHHQNN